MRKHLFFRIIILLLIISAAIIYDSNTRPVLTEYEVSSPTLPESFDGFTIVQLSDIHGGLSEKINGKIVEMTAEVQPDIIAITGDMVDAGTDMEIVDSMLAGLSEIAPVYFVSGNHEWAAGRIDKLAELAGSAAEENSRRMKEVLELLEKRPAIGYNVSVRAWKTPRKDKRKG